MLAVSSSFGKNNFLAMALAINDEERQGWCHSDLGRHHGSWRWIVGE